MLFSKIHSKRVTILSSLLFLIIAVSGLITLYDYYFPELNKDAVKFFFDDKKHIPDNHNALYSIIGLNAPSDVIDIHQFGLSLVNETLSGSLTSDNKRFSLKVKLLDFENELSFEGDSTKLLCWLYDEEDITDNQKEACYSNSDLISVIKKNHILLKRHEQIKKYDKYEDVLLFGTNGQLLINAHRLFLASIRLNLESGNNEAFELLINDLKYFRVLMRQPGAMVTKAIHMVLYNLSLTQLEYAIIHYTNVAFEYETELETVLSDISIEEFNLDGIIREEFELANSIFCLDESLRIETKELCQLNVNIDPDSASFIINDFYDFYLDYKHILSLQKDEMIKECNMYSYGSKPKTYLRVFLHLPVFKTHVTYILLKDGIVKGCALMDSHKSYSTKHRELRAYLRKYH